MCINLTFNAHLLPYYNRYFEHILKFIGPAVNPSVDFDNMKIIQPDLVYSLEFKNLLLVLQNLMVEKNEIYQQALTEIDDITLLIDEEVNKN